MILRPGGITLEQLRLYIPTIEVYNKVLKEEELLQNPPTPGLKYKHYSPKAEVILFEGSVENMKNALFTHIESLLQQNKKVGLIHTHPDTITIPETITKSPLFVMKELGSESKPGTNTKKCLCFNLQSDGYYFSVCFTQSSQCLYCCLGLVLLS